MVPVTTPSATGGRLRNFARRRQARNDQVFIWDLLQLVELRLVVPGTVEAESGISKPATAGTGFLPHLTGTRFGTHESTRHV
jgi:hypothetical protein